MFVPGNLSGQNDSAAQLSSLIENLEILDNSEEKIEALKEFALLQQTEKEREINQTIVAKDAEKEEAVNAVRDKMVTLCLGRD